MSDADDGRPRPYRTEEEAHQPEAARSATEPAGSEGSSRNAKTRTDPETGETTGARPDTAG